MLHMEAKCNISSRFSPALGREAGRRLKVMTKQLENVIFIFGVWQFQRHIKKSEGQKIPKVELQISIYGVKILDPKTKVSPDGFSSPQFDWNWWWRGRNLPYETAEGNHGNRKGFTFRCRSAPYSDFITMWKWFPSRRDPVDPVWITEDLCCRMCSITVSCTGYPSAPTTRRTNGYSPSSAKTQSPTNTSATCSTVKNVYVFLVFCSQTLKAARRFRWIVSFRRRRSPSPSARPSTWPTRSFWSLEGKTWRRGSRSAGCRREYDVETLHWCFY